MFPRPSACPNRFFVKFSTTYLTDIAFGQLLSLLVLPSSPLFFRRTRQRGRNRDREIGRVEKSKRKGRNFGESGKRMDEKEEEQKRGEGAKRVKKEGERIACVSYRLRASSHLRARTHSRGHLSRTHTPCSLSLSLFISVSLRRATTIRSGEKEEESHLREFPC